MSDIDHGAAAAATDAMDALATDPAPDTELHLAFAPARPATADDSARADLLLLQIREALHKYDDVRVAAADGFEELPASEGKHTIHHLSNWGWARTEARQFNPARPTSLLYREGTDGTLTLIGAMYTAPAGATPDQLDARIPISLARWHRHVNWCAPKSGSGAQWLAKRGGAPTYGPRSAIASRSACDSAGGQFYPTIFGWMVHVTFVGSDDPQVVWGGSLANPSTDSSARPDGADRGAGVQVSAAATPARAQAESSRAPALSRVPRPADAPAGQVPELEPPATINPATAASEPHPVPHPPTRVAEPPIDEEPTRAAAPASSRAFDEAATPNRVTNSLTSGHRTIAYERVMPTGPGPYPAILLLHGDGGLPPQEQRFEDMATALAKRQYVVEILHYFDRTGTIAAGMADRLVHFREWDGTVRDALTDLAHAPGVDSTRLGIFGTGVGASLALAVGAQDGRVRAVAEYGGSLPVWAVATVRHMPAVFIGESDADTPGAMLEANRVRALCEAARAPVQLEVYAAPNGRGRGNGVRDLRQRTFGFLEKYLKDKGSGAGS